MKSFRIPEKHQKFPQLTVRLLNKLMDLGLVNSEDVCRFCYTFALAGEEIWQLGAFERLLPLSDVIEKARASDERRQSLIGLDPNLESRLPLLDGLPVTIKANIAVDTHNSQLSLTAGSRLLGTSLSDGSSAAIRYNATSYNALDANGAVLIGVTSMDEFGMGSLGTNTFNGKPGRNPLPFLSILRNKENNLDIGMISNLIKLPSDAILEAHSQVAEILDPEEFFLSAGGSSCGGAISVSHGSSLISLGSDTGGSVRLPAAWCGITGLKPTYGHFSRHGLVSYASSLDCIGILAPTADCAGTAFHALTAYQETEVLDPTICSFGRIGSSRLDNKINPLATRSCLHGIKVGVPAAFVVSECPPIVRDAWLRYATVLASHGAQIKHISNDEISPSVLQQSLAAYYIICCAEASSNLARYDGLRYGCLADPSVVVSEMNMDHQDDFSLLERLCARSRSRGFGSEVIRRILCGTAVLSSDRFHTYYEAAAKLRAVLTQQIQDSLDVENCDLFILPTVLFPPASFKKDHEGNVTSEETATKMFANDIMTVPISLAGLPSISIPVPALPIKNSIDYDWPEFLQPSLQIVAGRGNESVIIKVAATMENWKHKM